MAGIVATVPPSKKSKAEAGRIGAAKRWGDAPRVVRIADLTLEQRRLVQALIDAARAANKAQDVAA